LEEEIKWYEAHPEKTPADIYLEYCSKYAEKNLYRKMLVITSFNFSSPKHDILHSNLISKQLRDKIESGHNDYLKTEDMHFFCKF